MAVGLKLTCGAAMHDNNNTAFCVPSEICIGHWNAQCVRCVNVVKLASGLI